MTYNEMINILKDTDSMAKYHAYKDGTLVQALHAYSDILMDIQNEQSNTRVTMFYIEDMPIEDRILVVHMYNGTVTDSTTVNADTRKYPMAVQIDRNGGFSRGYTEDMCNQVKRCKLQDLDEYTVIHHLQDGDIGSYAENEENGRMVEVTEMCGGRYLYYENGEVAGQSNSARDAYKYLIG